MKTIMRKNGVHHDSTIFRKSAQLVRDVTAAYSATDSESADMCQNQEYVVNK